MGAVVCRQLDYLRVELLQQSLQVGKSGSDALRDGLSGVAGKVDVLLGHTQE